MLIIGSTALAFHGLLPPYRERPRDLDAIMTLSEFKAWTPVLLGDTSRVLTRVPISPNKFLVRTEKKHYEIEIAWPGTAAEWLLGSERGLCTGGSESITYARTPALLALKLSHRYLRNSPHFLKTMRDIHWLRSHSVELTPELKEWLPWRERETYTYAHPNLMQDKQGFFNDEVPYRYDHDSLHAAVAYPDEPVYKSYAAPGEQVYSSRALWEPLPLEDKLEAVWEECAVLALERSIIPHGTDPDRAFMIALEKVCTSITSGWFREFAWENYDAVKFLHFERPDRLLRQFQAGLANGIIQPFKRKEPQ